MSYPLLERINAPGEIKNLPASDMPALCEEIRQFLIKSVSETGGHLSSNLGVVELTVALHRVLDFPQDKLLFDVGHQCYTHKLLTGRREGFAQLRRKNGISGFPSPRESDCDAFIAGHGSAALSTAIGIARAKKLKNEPGKVVVIVGDGAFTGGMVYESFKPPLLYWCIQREVYRLLSGGSILSIKFSTNHESLSQPIMKIED